ncbi:MAG: ArsR family transcriptional regulator [Candidatus Thermoplasmatota archaeon]
MNPIEASRIIADEYSTKILIATHLRPKNAVELSQNLSIPIAACYRRINTLEKLGLLVCVGRSLTQKGKRIRNYLSQLKDASIFLEEGQLKVRFNMKTGREINFGGPWTPLRGVAPSESASQ